MRSNMEMVQALESLTEAVDLLGEFVDTDPVGAGDKCHFCLTDVGEEHEPWCLWARAVQLGGGDVPQVGVVADADDPQLEPGEVVYPPDALDGPPVDPFQLVCEDARAALEAGLLHPGALEPVKQAARVLDELEDEEDLIPVEVSLEE